MAKKKVAKKSSAKKTASKKTAKKTAKKASAKKDSSSKRKVISKKKITYDSNNSGGDWWLKDEDWYALEAEGWDVHWARDRDYIGGVDKDGRWLGALATSASKKFFSFGEAVAEWERITGQNAGAKGCSCCGTPHSFHDDNYNYYDDYSCYDDYYDDEDEDW